MILFLGFMVCCLGICVSLLTRKVRELESIVFDKCEEVEKIESSFRELLAIQQRSVSAHSEAFTKLSDIVSKSIVEDKQQIAELEKSFIKFRGLIYEIIYGKKEQNNGNKETED